MLGLRTVLSYWWNCLFFGLAFLLDLSNYTFLSKSIILYLIIRICSLNNGLLSCWLRKLGFYDTLLGCNTARNPCVHGQNITDDIFYATRREVFDLFDVNQVSNLSTTSKAARGECYPQLLETYASEVPK